MSNKDQNISISSHSRVDEKGQLFSEAVVIKKMNLDAGWLGKAFGRAENAPTNICGMIGLLIIMVGAILFFVPTKIDPIDYWKSIAMPIITGILGYLFGKRN